MKVYCKRIIDAGTAQYGGRIMVVLFECNNNLYHWVTSSKTKAMQILEEGKTYNVKWNQGTESVSNVKILDTDME